MQVLPLLFLRGIDPIVSPLCGSTLIDTSSSHVRAGREPCLEVFCRLRALVTSQPRAVLFQRQRTGRGFQNVYFFVQETVKQGRAKVLVGCTGQEIEKQNPRLFPLYFSDSGETVVSADSFISCVGYEQVSTCVHSHLMSHKTKRTFNSRLTHMLLFRVRHVSFVENLTPGHCRGSWRP